MAQLLWLDDEKNPNDEKWKNWIINKFHDFFDEGHVRVYWVKSYKEFADFIDDSGVPHIICFDYDLGDTSDNPKTGYDCAEIVINYCFECGWDIPAYALLSDNEEGNKKISNALDRYHMLINKEDKKFEDFY